MKTLKQNESGRSVSVLKALLGKLDYEVSDGGVFDDKTKQAVKHFQAARGLQADGIVGPKTWAAIFTQGYDFKLAAKDRFLGTNDFFQEFEPKSTIYLHHTAGAHRPDYTIDWWKQDNQPGKFNRVATAFVIGRRSTTGDSTFDGITYRAHPEFFWAHHLGLKRPDNTALNAASIGIEICALGPLHKESEEMYYYQGGTKRINVPKSEVCILDQPWRGYRYFQKYTDQQIAECKRLILTLAYYFDIPIPNRTYTRAWFDIQEDAFKGTPGIWTHCNVRTDKTDCFPQPEFIAMLNSLHESFQMFVPGERGLDDEEFNPNVEYNPEEIMNYTDDLNEG